MHHYYTIQDKVKLYFKTNMMLTENFQNMTVGLRTHEKAVKITFLQFWQKRIGLPACQSCFEIQVLKMC